MYDKKYQEKTLIAKVQEDFFKDNELDCTEYIGDIDFCVAQKSNLFDKKQALFWAEAKRAEADNILSLIQLILTIGKARTHEKYLPPEFIGAFNCKEIVFVPFSDIAQVFNQNDFNFNVTPSDKNTKEFKQLHALLSKLLQSKSKVFEFFLKNGVKNVRLQRFIKRLRVRHKKSIKIGITHNNFFKKPYFEWCEIVKPTINVAFENPLKSNKFQPSEVDFYLADLFADENNETLIKANLRLNLQGTNYLLKYDESGKETAIFHFTDGQKAHKEFWSEYERPPKEQYQNKILDKRHLLAPKNKKEYQGAFYTPRIWALKAKEYLEKALGKGFERNYIIWDCAAGTGNLLEVFDESAKNNIYASTLDESDVKIMLSKVKNSKKFPLFEKHIFQFDFLNDSFFDEVNKNGEIIEKSKIPSNLQEILKDEEKRKKLIIFINPPYAEATSANTPMGTGKNKRLVAKNNKTSQDYKDILGKANNELFAQFFMRIYKELSNCILASFSTLKYVNSANFIQFREHFKAQFLKGFICPANTFDNTKGNFPIGFLIWNTFEKEEIEKIVIDIYDATKADITKAFNPQSVEQKNFYGKHTKFINQWIKEYDKKGGEFIALLDTRGNDFQNQQYIAIKPQNFIIKAHSTGLYFTQNNLIPLCIYFAVRQAIKPTWLNNRDQFLYPNDNWKNDKEFQNDCLAFALFHNQNRISFTQHGGGGGIQIFKTTSYLLVQTKSMPKKALKATLCLNL